MALRLLFCPILSGHLRQVSMYCDETEYMHKSRNFREGGSRSICIKSSDVFCFFFLFFSLQLMTTFFFCFFFSPQLILQKSNG